MKILIIEDLNSRITLFLKGIHKNQPNSSVYSCSTLADAQVHFLGNKFDIVFLDHDLLDEHYDLESLSYSGTGSEICSWLAGSGIGKRNKLYVIHSLNSKGAERMHRYLSDAGLNVIKEPFAWYSGKLTDIIKKVERLK